MAFDGSTSPSPITVVEASGFRVVSGRNDNPAVRAALRAWAAPRADDPKPYKPMTDEQLSAQVAALAVAMDEQRAQAKRKDELVATCFAIAGLPGLAVR
jgi:hypothetical protein